jgi:hypothetical protein
VNNSEIPPSPTINIRSSDNNAYGIKDVSERHNRHQEQWNKRSFPRKLMGIWNDEHRPTTGELKLNLFKNKGGKSKRIRRNKKRSKKTKKVKKTKKSQENL